MIHLSKPADLRITKEGQSNCVGVGRIDELTGDDAVLAASPFARVFIWNPGTSEYENLQFGTVASGANNQAASDPAYCNGGVVVHPEFGPCFGPELGIALRWMRETVGGNLYIDKNTGDGQPISYFQSGGAFFTESLARKAAADTWLSSRGIRAAHMGWLWVQGEGDHGADQATYQTALTTYISSRIAGNLQSAIDFRILAQINATSLNYGAGVAAAKAAYAAANPTTAKIIDYANSYNPDSVHLDSAGQLQLGYDAFEILFSKPHMTA
jgi:hypothetical protein